MPRQKYIPSDVIPYHVSARSHNQEWFSLPIEQVWDLMSSYLWLCHHSFGIRIHSFVLMNNHFHAIISTPNGNLAECMNYFMREVSKVIGQSSNRINQIFGGPHHRSLLSSFHYYMCAYKYVYRNPVEAGLSSTVEIYPFSTLHGKLGNSRLLIPVIDDSLLFEDVEQNLRWLNKSYPLQSQKHQIQKALRKKEFSFSQTKKGKPSPLNTILL